MIAVSLTQMVISDKLLCVKWRGGGNVMLSSFKTVQSSILGHASVFLDQSFTFHEKIRPW